MNFFKHWISEKTTWAGIILLVTSFNISGLTPEQNTALQLFGISLVARPEIKKE